MIEIKCEKLAINNVRQMSFSGKQNVGLFTTSDCIYIVDTILFTILRIIRRESYPRWTRLSQDGKYFVAHYSDNKAIIYSTKTGKQIQYVNNIPHSCRSFYFSGNSKKLIYGNNQSICIWNIPKAETQMHSENWRNINTFAINHQGDQFALGTYNGSIFILSIVGMLRCKQIEVKRHRNCIMALGYHKDKLISSSFDGKVMITTIKASTQNVEEKTIIYQQKMLSEVPKQIKSCGNNYFLLNEKGMYWYHDNGMLVGLQDYKKYSVYYNQDQDFTTVVIYERSIAQFWPIKQLFMNYQNKNFK